MSKLSKFLLLIIVCTIFLVLNHALVGFWHAVFQGCIIGWAASFIVDVVDLIARDIKSAMEEDENLD